MTEKILLAALLLVPASGRCEEPKAEDWNSFSMEATSLMGEMHYMNRDFSAAKERFRDSLNSSLTVDNPHGKVMALDLYRSAELAFRDKDFALARQHLEILTHRYPDSEWAEKGEALLERLPGENDPAADEQSPQPILSAIPELQLRRLQAALREDRVADALEECRTFSRRYQSHSALMEIQLLQGLLELRTGDPESAAATLSALLTVDPPGALRSKTVYLLGAARYLNGDFAGVRAVVPDSAGDKWTTLAQVWRAASDQAEGRAMKAAVRYEVVARSGIESPVKAYAQAALAAETDHMSRHSEAASLMRQAADSAERWGMTALAASSRLSLGHILYKQRALGQSAQAYEQFYTKYPDHSGVPFSLFQRGLALRREGRDKEASRSFERLVRDFPDSSYAADGHLQLGQVYTALGTSDKAIEHYERMADSPAHRPGMEKESILLIAQVHYNEKKFKDALPYYWRFLEDFPDDPKAGEVANLLLTSYWMGARSDSGLQKALALYPKQPVVANIRWELAKEAYTAKEYEKAEGHFKALAEDFPASSHAAESLFYRAESVMNLKDHAAAAEAYRAFLERFPADANARQAAFRLGAALYELQDFAGAEAAYAKADKGSDALAADAAFNRALALQKAGDKPGAQAAYERVLARFPRYSQASWIWFQVGSLREEAGQVKPAIEAFSKVTGDDKAQAFFRAGRLWEGLKNRAQARAVYEKLVPLRPANDPNRLHGLLRLGLLYELDSRAKKAMPLYKEVARLGTGTIAQTASNRLK